MSKPLFSRILVAVNGSEASIHAAMYGIIMAKTYHLDLKFIYVVDTATIKRLTLSKFFASDERKLYEENLIADGKKYLAYTGDLAKSKGVTAETELLNGAVWAEIVKAADNYDADFILLGGKIRDVSYTPSGSNRSDGVSLDQSQTIAAAKCSVIVVKQKDIEQLFKIA